MNRDATDGRSALAQPPRRTSRNDARGRLLAGIPAVERRLRLSGISTAVLEGGSGPPIVFLHGPGEFAAKWLRVIPDLVTTNRVIAPDLPAHGASDGADERLDVARMLAWVGDLIERTCTAPPVLVGHVLGGSIAARFALNHGDRLHQLVLVDSLGLAPFRPDPRFALAMIHFTVRPSPRTYDRLMHQCSADLDTLREEMAERWDPFAAYALERARAPASRAVGRLLREVGVPRIAPEDLARITVPTSLIWGRQDRANRIRIAEQASSRYGWPLHVIENCADDPARDQPAAFLEALRATMAAANEQEVLR